MTILKFYQWIKNLKNKLASIEKKITLAFRYFCLHCLSISSNNPGATRLLSWPNREKRSRFLCPQVSSAFPNGILLRDSESRMNLTDR